MNRAILSQRITSILADLNRLTNALYAMNTTDIQRYPDNYEVLSTDAALRAENIACRLRHLIYSTTNIKKDEYLTSAAVMQGINVEKKGDVLEITLPCLLPKRKQRQSTEYLLDPFTAAMSQYTREHPMPRFQHCVVCFSHIYCQDLPKRRVRDYDNLELKQFLDVACCATPTTPRSWAKRTAPASPSWTARTSRSGWRSVRRRCNPSRICRKSTLETGVPFGAVLELPFWDPR